MNERKNLKVDGWKILPRQPEPMPGQRFLFDQPDRPRCDFVDESGQQFLLDLGHQLPGVEESRQRILWDV